MVIGRAETASNNLVSLSSSDSTSQRDVLSEPDAKRLKIAPESSLEASCDGSKSQPHAQDDNLCAVAHVPGSLRTNGHKNHSKRYAVIYKSTLVWC